MTQGVSVTSPHKWYRADNLLPIPVFLILIGSIVAPFSCRPTKEVEILAAVSPQSNDAVSVSGRVLYNGRGMPNATIIAVAATRRGNEYSAEGRTLGDSAIAAKPGAPVENKIGSAGVFDLLLERKASPLPRPPLASAITSISLRANGGDPAVSGTEVLAVNHSDGFQQIEFSMAAVTPLVGLFIFGLFWAFRRPEDPLDRRFQYYVSVFSALALTMTMIAIIAISLRTISTRGGDLGASRRNVVMSLGFAYVFKGTYVKDVEPEWVFSFTTCRAAPRPQEKEADKEAGKEADKEPTNAAALDAATRQSADGGTTAPDAVARSAVKPAPPAVRHAAVPPPALTLEQAPPVDEAAAPIKGLGAPLWVLLLSVLGAAVLTISMVVSWVREPLQYDDEKTLRQRLEGIIRHQFYILFAPIGSVFVYQMLVAGEAAGQPLAVGVAAFGSGMALNRLLNLAVDAAMKFLPKRDSGQT